MHDFHKWLGLQRKDEKLDKGKKKLYIKVPLILDHKTSVQKYDTKINAIIS